MSKAKRLLALVLCVVLAGGLTAAHAEMVTVGIVLTGLIPADDGSFRSVTPEGEFRIIDFNDWPSFSHCREQAADAIVRLVRRLKAKSE